MVRATETPEDVRRYLGALVRYFCELRGCSTSALARAACVSDSRVRHLLNGTQVPNRHVLAAWARKLEVPDWVFLALLPAARRKSGYTLWQDAPREEDADVDRRRLLRFAATVGGAALAQLSPLLAAEAARRVELAAGEGGDGIGALEAAVEELGAAYLTASPAALFPELWARLARADELLPLARGEQRRRLRAASSALSKLLSLALSEVGAPDAAEATARSAYQLACQAGDDRLAASALTSLYSLARRRGRHAEAARHALEGGRLAPLGTPESVWLPVRHAGLLAELGRERDARESLALARERLRHVRRLSSGQASIWVLHPGDFHTFSAAAYLALGDHAQAAAHAREAIDLWSPGAGAGASPLHQGYAQVDLALAHLRAGRPDQAAAEGAAALLNHEQRPSKLLLARVTLLDQELRRGGHGGSAAAREFSELLAARAPA